MSLTRSIALAALVATFALIGTAQTAPIPQLLTLGPITVLNGTATVAGTVAGSGVGGELQLNGTPVAMDATGHFATVVSLDGASALDFGLTTASGRQVGFHIPLALAGPGGVIDGSVIDAVQRAGAALVEPLGGFQAEPGKPLTVAGSVADKGQLASLAVNGADVTDRLGPSQTFSVQLPGTTKQVTLQATDSNGVAQTTRYEVLQPQGLLRTSQGISVAAVHAHGLKVAKVRYFAKRVAKTKRAWMLVVLKDRRGYLVRGAKITVRAKAGGRLIRRSLAKKSNRTGRASFVLKVKPSALGKRLVMVTVARTPTAKAGKTTSVRLAKARR